MIPLLALLLASAPSPARAGEVNALRVSTGAAGGLKEEPPPIDLAACRPVLDARELLRLEYRGERLRSSADLERIESRGHRMFAYAVLQQLCSRRPTPVQEIVKFYRDPVTLAIEEGCTTAAEPNSYYEDLSRRVSFRHTFACTVDAMALLYHELAHAVVADHLLDGVTVWERVTLCTTEAHDMTIYDPDDRTLLLAMDARTHQMRALDEGIADAVALAFLPKTQMIGRLLRQFRLETQTPMWRRTAWEDKQRNEYLVTLAVAGYLGEGPREAVPRLNRLVSAGGPRQPRRLQDLLEAVSAADPVEARGRVDRVLQGLNAGWDNEREELLRLRREGR